nr:uncharacterized protein I203_06713 [Kwoniella mangroviensis CBS 8507]OCF64129.1 hypothetical protein I203_06713 [Kwoniella mangroviensis CBS 8507]
MNFVRHQDPKSAKDIHDKNKSNGLEDGMIVTDDITKTAATVPDGRAGGDSTEKITYKGWVAVDDKALEGKGNLVYKEYEVKPWDEDDVEKKKVLYCGLCGTDVMALAGDEGPLQPDAVCGHEIIGQVYKVGNSVENKLTVENEQACLKLTVTFNSTYHRGKATNVPSKGGFAKYWRGPSKFVIPIPSGLDLDIAGPLMCGGVTIYSPLERYNIGPGKKVGIVGVGGLGHMGIQFAKAMGAEVTAISRTESKKEDAIKLGAEKYIATGDDLKKAFGEYTRYFDLFPLADYISILKVEGIFCFIGLIPNPVEVPIVPLILSNAMIAGSAIGSPSVMVRMLNFAKEHNIKPWIQKYSMDDINKALVSFKQGEPRYRYILVNTDQGGEL